MPEIMEESKFDTLIVDEGQDFERDWFEIMRLFLQEGANILWLEDDVRNLQENHRFRWIDLFDIGVISIIVPRSSLQDLSRIRCPFGLSINEDQIAAASWLMKYKQNGERT